MRGQIFTADRVLREHVKKLTGNSRFDERTYQAAQAAACRVKGIKPFQLKVPILMSVNHGRWVGMCASCLSGMMTQKDWSDIRCFECGAIFKKVVWPKNASDIEMVLIERPVKNQNWNFGEPLEFLIAENIQHKGELR